MGIIYKTMKKTLLILILILFCELLPAPVSGVVFIPQGKVIHYDPMLLAFMKVESNFRTDVVNSLGYTGILQIGQEMIDEANRILRMQGRIPEFRISECLDSTKSVRLWYTIQNKLNPSYTLQNACRIWNSQGGDLYYQRIKKAML